MGAEIDLKVSRKQFVLLVIKEINDSLLPLC
jgi:hypothetical protein